MKPVHRMRILGLVGYYPGKEGPEHVGHNLDDLLGLAAMGKQVVPEDFQSLFSLADNRKKHRFFDLVQINEHGDAMVLAGFGFIESKSPEAAEINGVHGGFDVMLHHGPQSLIGHFKDVGRGQNQHFTHQKHGRLLESQRELASF